MQGGGGSSTGTLWYCVLIELAPRCARTVRPPTSLVRSSLLDTRNPVRGFTGGWLKSGRSPS